MGARITFKAFNALGELDHILRVPSEPINLEEIRNTFFVPPKRFAGLEDSRCGANPGRCGGERTFYRIKAVHIFTLPENVPLPRAFDLFIFEQSQWERYPLQELPEGVEDGCRKAGLADATQSQHVFSTASSLHLCRWLNFGWLVGKEWVRQQVRNQGRMK